MKISKSLVSGSVLSMLNRILLSIIMISFAVAQPSFTAADISTSENGLSSVFVADMDND